MQDKEYLGVNETAKYLGVYRTTIYRWLEDSVLRSKLGAYKFVGRWRFRVESLRKFKQGNGGCAGTEQSDTREKKKE